MREFGLDETALTEEEVAKRRLELKTLIKMGKTRGFLTHQEINDHLPEKLVDNEILEAIVSMLNDMGIAVYEQAPDAATLLIAGGGTTTATEEEAEEAAEAALSTVDSEFGRTTDPVRMYMREMGTVELLTREGEIEIAKRIEGGLQAMMLAISASPTTIAEILLVRRPHRSGRDGDLRSGRRIRLCRRGGRLRRRGRRRLLRRRRGRRWPRRQQGADEEARGAEGGGAQSSSTRCASTSRKCAGPSRRKGIKSSAYNKAQHAISSELMTIRFTVKTIEKLCDILRSQVDDVRRYEREIRKILVDKCGMPQEHFIRSFPPNMLNLKWAEKEIGAGKPYSIDPRAQPAGGAGAAAES